MNSKVMSRPALRTLVALLAVLYLSLSCFDIYEQCITYAIVVTSSPQRHDMAGGITVREMRDAGYDVEESR